MLEQQASERSLRVLTPEQCATAPARSYVLKGMLARGDHIQLIGQPGAGKSVLAPHMGYAVAQGRRLFGLRVRPGPVLYLACEDGHGMTARVRALHGRWGDAPNFHLVPDAVDLLNQAEDLDAVTRLLQHLQPVLVILDTLARAFPGLKENDPDGMGRVVRVVRDLIANSDAAVMVVHHVAKDGGETPRGHGSLAADADTVIIVSGSGGEPRNVRLTKNRNGSSEQAFTFSLVSHFLGEDEDGDLITAPIAEEVALRPAVNKAAAREAKLNPKLADLLQEFRAMQHMAGPTEPEPGSPIVSAITRGRLRETLITRAWFPETLLRDAPSSAKLTRPGYRTENHALTALKTKGFLNFNQEFVWLL